MISCGDYDYIEIVCLYRYPVKLTLKSGEVVEGQAIDTVRDEQRQECIKLEVENDVRLVVLDTLSMLEVCVTNPHFDKKVFE